LDPYQIAVAIEAGHDGDARLSTNLPLHRRGWTA
jgi:hypothetical protein